jgi:biotin carboxylase
MRLVIGKTISFAIALLFAPGTAFGDHAEHKRVVVIVDGYSTGRYLAPAIRGHGYDVLHVSSKIGRGLGITVNKKDFIDLIECGEDLTPDLKLLAPFQVLAVIPGAEAGVYLADELSNELKLPTSNSLKQSKARRDKFLMQELLRENSVSYIKQFKSNEVDAIISWSKQNHIMPVVLKPISSAGTDGVAYCNSEEDIREAFKNIISKPDIYGEKNLEVLAQEKVIAKDPGTEYAINTVSSYGRHFVAEIWRTKKQVVRNAPLYDTTELLSPLDPEFETLKHYISSVLDALGIQHGAGHSEVMLTSGGPVLIETAARPGGGNDPSALLEATGHSQISLLADSYLRPGVFSEMLSRPQPDLRKRVLITYLLSNLEGKIRKDLQKEPIFSLPGFHGLAFGLRTHDDLVQTTNLMNSPGMVVFVGSSREELWRSHHALRSMEQTLYREMLVPMETGDAAQAGGKPLSSSSTFAEFDEKVPAADRTSR